MSRNVPTASDVPWAVGGSHRYDFGGESVTHTCLYTSSTGPCQWHDGEDYSGCGLRCWGWGGGGNVVPGRASVVHDVEEGGGVGDGDGGVWPNNVNGGMRGVNGTPWVKALPTASCEFRW